MSKERRGELMEGLSSYELHDDDHAMDAREDAINAAADDAIEDANPNCRPPQRGGMKHKSAVDGTILQDQVTRLVRAANQIEKVTGIRYYETGPVAEVVNLGEIEQRRLRHWLSVSISAAADIAILTSCSEAKLPF